MGRKARGGLAALFLTTAIAGTVAGPDVAQADANKNYVKISANAIGKSQRVSVGLNKSLVIDLPEEAYDILVANPGVADAVTRTSKRIYIFAKQVGETNIFIFDRAGRQLISLDLVIERDVEGLQGYLAKYIPGSDIKVEIVNDNIILTGTVANPQDSAMAQQLAEVFVHGGAATTSSTASTSTGTIINFGDTEQRESKIVNLLQVEGEDQVHLKVTVAEVQRTVAKQLGIDLTGSFGLGGLVTNVFTDNPFGLGKPLNGSFMDFSASSGNSSIAGVMRAMNQSGVMRTLAEPSLTAISGETASFKVGGTYYLTAGKSEGNGSVTYSSKEVEYGISLQFTPVVLTPGRISLKIATSVSEPTSEGSFTIDRGNSAAATMPGLREREAETSVELPSGGSMVIAGLLKDDVRQTVSGFPGLSKVPVLGTLFRSRDYQRSESELVVIVTPYLVKPMARQALARPDDNFNPPSDGAGMFLGRVNRVYGTVSGNLPKGRYHGNPGFIFK